MNKKSISAALRSVTALLLSAAISAGSVNLFAVPAAAEDNMLCKVVYTDKYTYLTVTPSDDDNRIYYSVDGTKPDMDSKLYKNRLRASAKVTIRLVEYDENGEEVDRKKLMLKRKCIKPEMTAVAVEEGIEVTLETSTEDAVIYYTTNGRKPTSSSKVYEGPFVVEEGTTIRAVTAKSEWLCSSYLRTTAAPSETVKVETASEDTVMTAAAKVTDSSVILKLFEETNKYRVENGLPELKLDADLCKAASIRADELLASNYSCKHSRLDGRKWYTVLDEIGYNYYYGAENIAYTKGDLCTANTVMQLWIDSKTHRDNILNTYGDSVGFAYTKNGSKVYWVQIFGKQK